MHRIVSTTFQWKGLSKVGNFRLRQLRGRNQASSYVDLESMKIEILQKLKARVSAKTIVRTQTQGTKPVIFNGTLLYKQKVSD